MCFSLACCACEACAGATCSLCGKLVPVSFGRIMYVFLLLALSLASWCVGMYLPISTFEQLDVFAQCSEDSRMCYLTLTVTRVMFAMALFHFIQALVMIGVKSTKDPRHGFQEGWWPIKIPILAGLIIAAIFIPNKFYIGYEWVSFVGATFFIIVQLIMLIDFACDWAHNWIVKMEESNDDLYGETTSCSNPWYLALLGCTLAMFAGSLTITVLLFVFYTQKEGSGTCAKGELNKFFISFNLILSVIVSVISLLPAVRERKPDSGLFQAGVLSIYTSYLVFSAIASEPHSWITGCNSVFNTDEENSAGQKTVIIIGAIMTVLAVVYSTFRVSESGNDKLGLEPKSVTGLVNDKDDEEAHAVLSDDNDGPVSYNHSAFHFVFMFGCMYAEQLLTNWNTISHNNGNDNVIATDSGPAAVWVKMASSWLVVLLYIWSLLAPIIFPDRDFGSGV